MPTPIPITIFGVRYKSLRAAARTFNIAPNTFHRYITTYLTDPEAVAIASDYLVRMAYIGSDGRAYHCVPWSRLYVTTREIVQHYRPDLLPIYDKYHPKGKHSPFLKGGDA